jgi:hypothetical protein
MDGDADTINQTLRTMLNKSQPDGVEPQVAITLTCSAFEDSPIIGTLIGFEEVTGQSVEETIGRNCRFLNQGCQNDPNALSFMRGIQASPDAARSFTRQHPAGKQFVLMNKRPVRTLSSEKTEPPYVYFFNLIHIFGVEVVVHNVGYPVLCGVQWVMMTGGNLQEAASVTRRAHRLLASEESDLSGVFDSWAEAALAQYIQLHAATVGEQGLSIPPALEYKHESLQDFETSAVSFTDSRDRVCLLIKSLADAEGIAKRIAESSANAKQSENPSEHHFAQAQFVDMVDLREEVFSEFRTDLLQFISWYMVKSDVEGGQA